ncbi:hypothetical protein J6590_003030 [Homalodisca vitripennis]|nr:hypothetical protein J6590_003030 [Homalodisca vitripennis]
MLNTLGGFRVKHFYARILSYEAVDRYVAALVKRIIVFCRPTTSGQLLPVLSPQNHFLQPCNLQLAVFAALTLQPAAAVNVGTEKGTSEYLSVTRVNGDTTVIAGSITVLDTKSSHQSTVGCQLQYPT